ncbi:hypothetical protein [Christensenella tenuis]|uniref:Uncharacterized protein n=1 Tax=Christensenella tenuis TaxID=2763033 RepID=A0ABR7EEE0_9FIRM|nr:hypothetical protein [Christensenella tenuis]MBC5647464.1 hypothetical protein [Christensenella tenuis]
MAGLAPAVSEADYIRNIQKHGDEYFRNTANVPRNHIPAQALGNNCRTTDAYGIPKRQGHAAKTCGK